MRWRRSRTSSTSNRRTRSATPARSPTWRRSPAGELGSVRGGGPHAAACRPRARSRAARGLELDLGQAGAARARRMGAGSASPPHHRADAAAVRGARAARCRSPSSTASGSTAPAIRVGCPGPRSPAQPESSAPPTRTRRCASHGRTAPRARRRMRRAELRADVRAGRHDGDAVEAVLGAAGHRVPRRREGPAGLTQREIEVLAAARPRSVEQADRRAARDLTENGGQPRRAHLRQDRRLHPGAREPVRDAARLAARRGVRVGVVRRPDSPAVAAEPRSHSAETAKDGANASCVSGPPCLRSVTHCIHGLSEEEGVR